MQVLRARIYEQKRLKEAKERSELRREQMGTGERSEKIRTYNFPQVHYTTHCMHRIFQGMQNNFIVMLAERETLIFVKKQWFKTMLMTKKIHFELQKSFQTCLLSHLSVP